MADITYRPTLDSTLYVGMGKKMDLTLGGSMRGNSAENRVPVED